MQFSPKKTERYLSALRIYLHNAIAAKGINEKRLMFAKKLFICHILCKKPYPIPTDATLFCKALLSAAQVQLLSKHRELDVHISGDAVLNIDREILTALLLEIANLTKSIKVRISQNSIALFFEEIAPKKRLSAIIRAAGGIRLTLPKKHLSAVFLPLTVTQNKSIKITGAIELLMDPLSSVNIFTLSTD